MIPRSERVVLALALLAAALVMVGLRLHTFDEPFERDIDIYLQVARGLLDGGALYSTWVDIKPPPTFLVYAAALAATPGPEAAVFVIGVACALGTLLGVVVLARALVPGVVAAPVAAALLWAFVGSDLHFQANQPNTEVLLNLAFVWGCVFAWREAWWRAGALFALAVFTKQLMLVPVGAVALACAFGSGVSPSVAGRRLAAMLVPTVAVWLLAFGWFALSARGAEFWHLMAVYPREYSGIEGSGGMLGNLRTALGPATLGLPGLHAPMLAGLLLTLLAIGVSAFSGTRRVAWLLAAWSLGAWLAVMLPGHGYAHYFQLWLPLFAIALAVVVGAAQRLHTLVPWTLAVAVIAVAALRLGVQWQLAPTDWSRAKYGPQFVVAEEIARELAPMLLPQHRIFVWGVFPDVYRVLQRTPPTGLVNTWMSLPQYGRSWAPRWRDQLMRDLEANPPDFVLVDRVTLGHTAADHPIQAWLRGYVVFARTELFVIAVRRGSAAQTHLRAHLAKSKGDGPADAGATDAPAAAVEE